MGISFVVSRKILNFVSCMLDIAVIDGNILACMGLEQMLRDIMPMAEVYVFQSYEELLSSRPERFAHFFVSSAIYFEHAQFFISQPRRSIVLVHGDNYPRIAGLLTLNVCQTESGLAKSLLMLQRMGHPHGSYHAQHGDGKPGLLSQREIEVAVLLAKGRINKEVAERLNISLATVISHRKNIMAKLKARSLADIIIYVVMSGLLCVDEL